MAPWILGPEEEEENKERRREKEKREKGKKSGKKLLFCISFYFIISFHKKKEGKEKRKEEEKTKEMFLPISLFHFYRFEKGKQMSKFKNIDPGDFLRSTGMIFQLDLKLEFLFSCNSPPKNKFILIFLKI